MREWIWNGIKTRRIKLSEVIEFKILPNNDGTADARAYMKYDYINLGEFKNVEEASEFIESLTE